MSWQSLCFKHKERAVSCPPSLAEPFTSSLLGMQFPRSRLQQPYQKALIDETILE